MARKVVAEIPPFYGAEFEPLTRKIHFALDHMYDLDAPIRELNGTVTSFLFRFPSIASFVRDVHILW